MVQSQLRGV